MNGKMRPATSTLIDPSVNGVTGSCVVTLDTIEGKGTDLVPGQFNRKIAKTVGELDWDGKVVWSFGEKAPGGASQQHHDWARLPKRQYGCAGQSRASGKKALTAAGTGRCCL